MRLLRVATFNIKHGQGPDQRVDLERLGEACARLDADVLGLQEVDIEQARSHGADLVDVVAMATGMHGTFGLATTVDGGMYGNALLSREPLTEVETVMLPGGGERRSVLLASTSGVSVAVTHLSVGDQYTRQVPAVLAALGDRPAPRLLMGDFNHEWPDVPGYALAGGGPTFPASMPARRIDHIAVHGLKIVTTTVLQLDVSDHRALVATLGS